YHRTLRELIDPDDAGDFDQLIQLVKDRIDYYNNTRYHSAIGFVTPHSKYTGKADQIIQERERKLARAREQRKQQNLSLMKNKAA
ncbi:MAG: IS3 family transposase, partial [Calditrichaeota bacterium]|nr:IS3 family transposase [Calditrichota bacterium]